jgi:hypothetical protein
MENMSVKLKATDLSFASVAFLEEDPKEMIVAINEISYNLCPSSLNGYTACYWLEWILEYDAMCKSKKIPCIAKRRYVDTIENKYQQESIWIIWDIIKYRAEEKQCKIIIKIIESLFDMYCLRFSSGVKKRRKYLIYNCISLLTEPIDLTIPIWADKTIISATTDKLILVYKEIKKNEICPKTDYLFNGLDRSNADKTREKIAIMNNILHPPA